MVTSLNNHDNTDIWSRHCRAERRPAGSTTKRERTWKKLEDSPPTLPSSTSSNLEWAHHVLGLSRNPWECLVLNIVVAAQYFSLKLDLNYRILFTFLSICAHVDAVFSVEFWVLDYQISTTIWSSDVHRGPQKCLT